MVRLTGEEWAKLSGSPAQQSKYRNKKVSFLGEQFDSKKELDYWLVLRDREKRGVIIDLKRQVSFEIQPAFVTPAGEKIKAITYKADFVYYDTDGRHVIDVKGYKTKEYILKKKLLAYRGVYIEEV